MVGDCTFSYSIVQCISALHPGILIVTHLIDESEESKNFAAETDWNIITQPSAGMDDRHVKASRGEFLGGSSGCNGTLCIPGVKQDYDDWNLPGRSGNEVWDYMKKL